MSAAKSKEASGFDAVQKFCTLSVVLQQDSADGVSVGAKALRGPHGERGFLVVADNSSSGGGPPFDTLDELQIRSQEDDDSDAEDVAQYRLHSLPEAKLAPFYCRMRIGLDSHTNQHGTDSSSSTNKVCYVAGVDDVVQYSTPPPGSDGNTNFTFEFETAVNASMRRHASQMFARHSSIVFDDRDHTDTMWNYLGEFLQNAVEECAATKGMVKVFAIAVPAVTLVSSTTYSKLYDLSKLPEDEASEAVQDDGVFLHRRPEPPPEPSLQYTPSRDEYGLVGVSSVDLLLPPDMDPEEPSPSETPQQTVKRKMEQIQSLLYLWRNGHRDAMLREGAAHAVFLIQLVPDLDKPETASVKFVVGLFDETRSNLCNADNRREKGFQVWTKDFKDGEHHSQRLTSATASISMLIFELVKLLGRGGSMKEATSSSIRQLVRSHVITRLLKGTLCSSIGTVSWICCLKKGQESNAASDTNPYSNESKRLVSYTLLPATHFMYLRQFEVLSFLNKYRLRRQSTAVRSAAPSAAAPRLQATPPTGARREQPSARLQVQRGYFHVNSRNVVEAKKRVIILIAKLQDEEQKRRLVLLRQEKTARVTIDRFNTQLRLKEYMARRKAAIEKKKVEIKVQMQQVRVDKIRRNQMKKKRQFTPPGRARRVSEGDTRPPPRALTPQAAPPKRARQGGAAAGAAKPRLRPMAPHPPTSGETPARPAPNRAAGQTRSTSDAGGGGGSSGARQEPTKPANGRTGPPQPRSTVRQGLVDLVAPLAKKIETDEFMKRAMLEQECTKGVKKIIQGVDDSEIVERFLIIAKGQQPPPRAAAGVISRRGSVAADQRTFFVTQAASSSSIAANDIDGREQAISPVSSASSTSAAVVVTTRRASVGKAGPPSAAGGAVVTTTANATAKQPAAAPPPVTQAHRSPVSSRSSSSRSRSPVSDRSRSSSYRSRTPSPTAVKSPVAVAMEPIPVESSGVNVKPEEKEEFYRSSGSVRKYSRDGSRVVAPARHAGSTVGASHVVSSVSGSTTVTRTVIGHTTMEAFDSAPPVTAPAVPSSRAMPESPVDEVEDEPVDSNPRPPAAAAPSSSPPEQRTEQQEEGTEQQRGGAERRESLPFAESYDDAEDTFDEDVAPKPPQSAADGSSSSLGSDERTAGAAAVTRDSADRQADVGASATVANKPAVTTGAKESSPTQAAKPFGRRESSVRILADASQAAPSSSRKRFASSDFGDLGTFDGYGADEAPKAVVAAPPPKAAPQAFLQSPATVDLGGGDADSTYDTDRRISHLMNSEDLDVLDL